MPAPLPPFDPTAARLERELKHGKPLIGCRFDPTGRFLFVSSQDDTVQRFDLLTVCKDSDRAEIEASHRAGESNVGRFGEETKPQRCRYRW